MVSTEYLEDRRLMSVSPVVVASPVRVSHPLLNGAQTQHFKKLERDLFSLYRKGHINTADLLQAQSDASTALVGATRPSSASITKLKTDLRSAFSDKMLTTAEKTELSDDVTAALISANISTAAAERVATDVNAIISSSGITTADEKLILGDVKAILSSFKAARS